MQSRGDIGFCVKMSVANTLGYLMATIPPLVVDPKLLHHARYGARSYAVGWLVVPIGLVVGLLTFLVMSRIQKRNRPFWTSGPLLVACILSLPLFLPEFPHANVLGTTAICFALSTLTTWIHYHALDSEYATDEKIDRAARLERAKEEIVFWRSGLTAFLGVFLVVMLSWSGLMIDLARRIDTDPSEQMLLYNVVGFNVTFAALFIVFGPLAEAADKCREAQRVLLKIESK